MFMQTLFDKYEKRLDITSIDSNIDRIQGLIKQKLNTNYLKQIFSYIDFTSLNTADNENDILRMVQKLNRFSKNFPGIHHVAAICVWPSLVYVPKRYLDVPGIKIASVAGGFPSSQTFLEVKCTEAESAVEAGADEVDIVMNVGKFLSGDYISVAGEINAIKRSIGNTHLKVILETGLLENADQIRKASLLAMQSGADFIKTSTGKISPAATYRAVYVMADAIGDFYRKTGKKTGIKPAGGIIAPEDAAMYSAITEEILGEGWMTPEFFRIGASRLGNNLLAAITKPDSEMDEGFTYF